MKDDGFDFGSAERRERRSFEIPPWEQDAFERLGRSSADTESTEGTPQQEPQPATNEVAAVQEPAAVVDEVEVIPEKVSEPVVAGEVDPVRVTEMMELLKAEEKPSSGWWKYGMIALIVQAAIGSVMVIWGATATVKARAMGAGSGTGVAGGLALLVLGTAFAGVAVYVAVKTLRERGVL